MERRRGGEAHLDAVDDLETERVVQQADVARVQPALFVDRLRSFLRVCGGAETSVIAMHLHAHGAHRTHPCNSS